MRLLDKMINTEIDSAVNNHSILNSSFQTLSFNLDISIFAILFIIAIVFAVCMWKVCKKLKRAEQDLLHLIHFSEFSASQVRPNGNSSTSAV